MGMGEDAGKPPFDQVSHTLYSMLRRFCTVKLSFFVRQPFRGLNELDVNQAHCKSIG